MVRDDKLDPILHQVVTEARRFGVVPVCGAGFSLNALPPFRPQQWRDLIDLVLDCSDQNGCSLRQRVGKKRLAEVLFLADDCSDYLTALSLLETFDNRSRRDCLESMESLTMGVKRSMLPVHQSFWSCDWPLVVTTNYDHYLEVACGCAQVFDYGLPEITRRVQHEIDLRDSNVVLHLHGSFGDQAPPLVIWKDYLEAYGWFSADAIDELAVHMVKTSGLSKAKRNRYEALLRTQLRAAELSARKVYPGRIPQVIDDLLANKTCLFIGFSFVDPIWRLLLHRLEVSKASAKHFMVAKSSVPNYLRHVVRRIPLADFDALKPMLDSLSIELGLRTISGAMAEARMRQSEYKDLRVRYPEFSKRQISGFVAQGRNSRGIKTLVPFVEVWFNRMQLPDDRAIKVFNVALDRFKVATKFTRLRRDFWRYRLALQQKKRDSKPLSNEAKVRVREAKCSSDGTLLLDLQLADYQDFLVTNHLVANMDPAELECIAEANSALAASLEEAFVTEEGDFDPRSILCGDEESIALSASSLCSNHLGVSVLIVVDIKDGKTDVPAFLCPTTRGQISSPRDIVMTASGSVDWPLAADMNGDDVVLSPREVLRSPEKLRLDEQIWREFAEECLSGSKQADSPDIPSSTECLEGRFCAARHAREQWIARSMLISLCQNVERGGKPELFYVASIRGSGVDFIHNVLEFNWEMVPIHNVSIIDDVERARGRRQMMCLRSPLDRELQIIDDPEPAYKQMIEVILDSRFNPVFRAHLVAVLRWCVALRPKETKEILEKLGTNRDLYIIGL